MSDAQYALEYAIIKREYEREVNSPSIVVITQDDFYKQQAYEQQKKDEINRRLKVKCGDEKPTQDDIRRMNKHKQDAKLVDEFVAKYTQKLKTKLETVLHKEE